jgi:cytoskeletal protein RodZ
MNPKIGEQLRQAREARELSLEQVARETLIRVRYLQAMEAGEFSALPSQAQARGFLRTYAGFLRLDERQLLRDLEEEEPNASPPTQAPSPADVAVKANYQQADAIFVEIGMRLKQQRELLGLSLEDVVQYTHLREHYLKALESGQLDQLPSPVQGRGMLSNYAAFLGLDVDPLMLRFAEGLQARLVARQAVEPTRTRPKQPRKTARGPLRRFFSVELILGGGAILLLAGIILWGAVRIYELQTQLSPTPSAPSIAEVLLITPSPTTSPTTTAPSSTNANLPALPQPPAASPASTGTAAAPVFTMAPGAGVQVYLTVLQRAWLRVTVDGEVEFEGRVLPGSAYTFSGEDQIELITGNGAAIQVFYNQFDQGVLGLIGEVVNVIYTATGVVTPTPTITPTWTATVRATATSANLPVQPGGGTTPTAPALP